MSNLTVEKVSLLMKSFLELNISYHYEQSFQVQNNLFLPNRFLLSMNKNLLGGNYQEKIIKLCNTLKIPENFMIDIEQQLPHVNFIHFGFEENEKAHFYKVYLEFKQSSEQLTQSPSSFVSPILKFQGYKWDSSNPNYQFLTDYWLYPSLSLEPMLENIFNIYSQNICSCSFLIIKKLLTLVLKKVDIKSLYYLEIREKTNYRKSYDLNIYNAQIQLKDVYLLLIEIFRLYSIPESVFQSFYPLIMYNIFGHISGGLHRNGQDFFNLYWSG